MPSNVDNKGPITNLFKRMDANDDGAVTKKEVVKHFKAADVPSGLFGMVHKKGSSAFVDKLDANKDKKVTWDEFQGVSAEFIPEAALDEAGNIDREKLGGHFKAMDANADGTVNYDELENGTLAALPADTSHRGTIAEVAAKLGLDALDMDRDGAISPEEMDAVADEVDLIAGSVSNSDDQPV